MSTVSSSTRMQSGHADPHRLVREAIPLIQAAETHMDELEPLHCRLLLTVGDNSAELRAYNVCRDTARDCLSRARAVLLSCGPSPLVQAAADRWTRASTRLREIVTQHQRRRETRAQVEEEFFVASDGTTTVETHDDPRVQQQVQSREIDTLLMTERSEEIRRIESDVLMLQEMFTDLSVMVHESDQNIEVLVSRVESAKHETEEAVFQLAKAERAANKRRWRTLYIVLGVAAVVVTIGIATPFC